MLSGGSDMPEYMVVASTMQIYFRYFLGSRES